MEGRGKLLKLIRAMLALGRTHDKLMRHFPCQKKNYEIH